MLGFIGLLILITRGGGVSRIMMVSFLLMKGLGWVDSLGMRSLPQEKRKKERFLRSK